MESSAANTVPVPNIHDPLPLNRNTAFTANINLWRSNNGNLYNPRGGDNIILSGPHNIEINNDINLGDINNFGYRSNIAIAPYIGVDRAVSINNIINDNGVLYRNAGRDALGRPLAYGNANATIQLELREVGVVGQGVNNATLIINGNDISAVDSIILGGGQSKIVFQNPITVDAEIYARTNNAGYIEAKNDTVFNKTIGFSGGQNHSITGLLIEDNKTVTLKSDIYASDIDLKASSKLIIDASKQNITVRTGIATDLFGNMNDDTGRIQIKSNTKNAITFYNNIGGIDERVAEIDIARGKKTEFKSDVYAKSIKVAANDVEFHEKLDMQRRNGGVHTGNLEFTKYGKVKFHKDFTGDITTSKINVGEVTYVNTPNIYGVGALNKRIEKLVFTGNHLHNLHKNIHAARTEFDAGTYNIHTNPITIDGNANINGSTFDLRYDLIFTGNVELSNNIRINSAGNRVVFQNHAPTVNNAGTNITFNINGAPPANEAAALAVLHINVGGVVFPPVGSRYDVGTATLILPGLGGAQVQQQQQQVQQNQQQNNHQPQQVERNQQQQVQREDNERAIAEENNRRIEEQRLQAENQQRQANEIREYVNKPEPQKLAEAINNTIVAHAKILL